MPYITVSDAARRFKNDSSVAFAWRSSDKVLKHIDWLLKCYETATRNSEYGKRRVILVDLYLACKYWQKSFARHDPGVKAGRGVAMVELFEATRSELIALLEFQSIQELEQYIDEMYSRDVSDHAITID
jgi:hypothetical protein